MLKADEGLVSVAEAAERTGIVGAVPPSQQMLALHVLPELPSMQQLLELLSLQ